LNSDLAVVLDRSTPEPDQVREKCSPTGTPNPTGPAMKTAVEWPSLQFRVLYRIILINISIYVAPAESCQNMNGGNLINYVPIVYS
jgi:hypothetical protein